MSFTGTRVRPSQMVGQTHHWGPRGRRSRKGEHGGGVAENFPKLTADVEPKKLRGHQVGFRTKHTHGKPTLASGVHAAESHAEELRKVGGRSGGASSEGSSQGPSLRQQRMRVAAWDVLG